MSNVTRAVIKLSTLDRLEKYARVRIRASVDDLINDALDNLERQLRMVPKVKA